jgi:GTP-binding protein LepA
MKNVRNFSIIAHIDHGKSTLADRLMEATGAVSDREKHDQMLDKLDLERERGITIKAQTVRLNYRASDGKTYELNLIDTPGHVDFNYEVSRSLAACEGALLVVDASQGVQAQTLANVYLALDHNLEILPVLNKIDLPSADPEKVKKEIEDVIGLDISEAVAASAKTGEGVGEILEKIVRLIPPPTGEENKPTQALVFDSWFDPYQGVVVLVRVFNGEIKKGKEIRLMAVGKNYLVDKMGVFTPNPKEIGSLKAGEVGYFTAALKDIHDVKIGDTVTNADNPAAQPLPGFKEVKPMVFCGIYPTDSGAYDSLRDSLEKLALNDSSFHYEPETSLALGFGFRCGFLGLLHMEIIQERLEREYNLELISTAPTVVYRVKTTTGEILEIDNPAKMPSVQEIEDIEEPYIRSTVHLPSEFLGQIIQLCEGRRGIQTKMEYLTQDHVALEYELPLSEVVFDFYDKLKSLSKGYASFDYDLIGYRSAPLVKLQILINGDPVDALSVVIHREHAQRKGRELCEKLREIIPRQQFEVAIQAAIGGRIIARETVKPMRKNVLAKCYGGDITRKRKLLEKQKAGKKRMKQVGNVEIPQEAFLAALKID